MRFSRPSSLSAAALAAVAAVVAVQAPASAAGDPVVDFTFDTVTGSAGLSALDSIDLTNLGSVAADVSIVSSGGGVIAPAYGADGDLDAVRFPHYDGGLLDATRAVIAVSNPGGTDRLTPGDDDFSYGATFRLSAENHGTDYDNGNNIIQRGLYNQGAQFKLQLDGGTAGCRVLGDDGDLIVKTAVPTREWYAVTCSLSHGSSTDTLTISAAPVDGDGNVGSAVSESVSGPVGDLTYDVETPLSVGGKLTNALNIMDSSDQFNGRIDAAFLSID